METRQVFCARCGSADTRVTRLGSDRAEGFCLCCAKPFHASPCRACGCFRVDGSYGAPGTRYAKLPRTVKCRDCGHRNPLRDPARNRTAASRHSAGVPVRPLRGRPAAFGGCGMVPLYTHQEVRSRPLLVKRPLPAGPSGSVGCRRERRCEGAGQSHRPHALQPNTRVATTAPATWSRIPRWPSHATGAARTPSPHRARAIAFLRYDVPYEACGFLSEAN